MEDQVLKTIAEAITARFEWAKLCQPSKKIIAFVKVGEQPNHAKRAPHGGILASASLATIGRPWAAVEVP